MYKKVIFQQALLFKLLISRFSNPIWNSDFFSEFDAIYILFIIFVIHFGGWLVPSLICLNVTVSVMSHMCQSSFGCVTARCGSSPKPTFHPCSPQSPSSSVVRASILEHRGSWVQIPSGTRIFFPGSMLFISYLVSRFKEVCFFFSFFFQCWCVFHQSFDISAGLLQL